MLSFGRKIQMRNCSLINNAARKPSKTTNFLGHRLLRSEMGQLLVLALVCKKQPQEKSEFPPNVRLGLGLGLVLCLLLDRPFVLTRKVGDIAEGRVRWATDALRREGTRYVFSPQWYVRLRLSSSLRSHVPQLYHLRLGRSSSQVG